MKIYGYTILISPVKVAQRRGEMRAAAQQKVLFAHFLTHKSSLLSTFYWAKSLAMSSSISRFEIARSLRPITLINQVSSPKAALLSLETGLAFFCLVFPWDGRGGEEWAESDKVTPKTTDYLNSISLTK